jgi:peptidyl-prolyl cis-trans isomerase SurA
MIKSKLKIFFFVFLILNNNDLFGFENKILVKIDNKIITAVDLKNKIRTVLILSNEKVNQENINKSKSIALRALLELRLKEIEIERFGIEVSEAQLFKQLLTMAKNDKKKFEEKFINNNLNLESFKKEIEIELAWKKLMFSLYSSKVEINNKEIDEEIKQIKINQSNMAEFNISEISINFIDENDKIDKIKKINDQIKLDGFGIAASKISESISSTENGNLGWINAEAFSKKISVILKTIQIGDIAEPIIDNNNILLLKLNDKRSTKINNQNLGDLKNNLIARKKNELFNLYSKSYLSKLKNTSLIEYK